MSNVLSMNTVRGRVQDPGTVRDSIDFSDGSGPARVVAYPERELPPGGIPSYLAARKSGARAFVLWADEHRRERVATVMTQSAAGGVATFQVLSAHGEHIGTIVREKAFRGRGLRTRWTVTPPGGPDAVGYKGRIVWWFVWWLCLPLMVLIVLASVVDSSPSVGGAARGPGASDGGRAAGCPWSSGPAATSCTCTNRTWTGGSGPRWSPWCAASAPSGGTP